MFGIARKFASTVLPGVVKPMRVLWNEVIGFLFLSFGVIFALGTWRKYRDFTGDLSSLVMLMMSVVFVGIMFGFGISSFLRARKINRS